MVWTLAMAASGTAQAQASSVALLGDELVSYEAVRDALRGDDLASATIRASALATLAVDDPSVATPAHALAVSPDLAAARHAFSEVSRGLITRVAASTDAPKVVVFHCGMWDGYPYWLQPRAGIANPYMGTAMPECGEQTTLKVALKAALKAGP